MRVAPKRDQHVSPERLETLANGNPSCEIYRTRIDSLASYVDACAAISSQGHVYWFRGQGVAKWRLIPWALRFRKESDRSAALKLVDDFKRIARTKLSNPPQPGDELLWVQTAQHYGLPTRLLDWTENAAIALYFACQDPGEDGLVFALDPVDLNTQVDPDRPRVFDGHRDQDIIRPYLELTGRRHPKGRLSIAVNPVWNSERIVLQKGAFTLHGARQFAIVDEQAKSLVALAILSEDKSRLLDELRLMGVDEMALFPEPEHVCRHLVRVKGLLLTPRRGEGNAC